MTVKYLKLLWYRFLSTKTWNCSIFYRISSWPLSDTCQLCSTSPANHELCSRAYGVGGFQNQGVCLQAFPLLPSPSILFCSRPIVRTGKTPKPCSLLPETLAMQAKGWPTNAFFATINLFGGSSQLMTTAKHYFLVWAVHNNLITVHWRSRQTFDWW